MMINQYLFDGYEEFHKEGTFKVLDEFIDKTFPRDGTDKLFMGCVVILYTTVINKNYANTHSLLSILMSGKEEVDGTNLLRFYFERVNDNKIVSKYLKKELYSDKFQEHLDMLIDYFSYWSYDMRSVIRRKYEEKKNKSGE